ncbi:MAG TPA: hypothetical protein VGR66_05155 [Candidatus Eisenbacteria bacterium]|nr:hypothetical protein [Candidatus Eisenbacteria bacterium]
MNRANALTLLTVLVLSASALAGIATAGSVSNEIPQGYMGHVYLDVTTGSMTWEANPAPLAAVDVYRTGPSALGGLTSTDFTARWGDEVTTTATGILDQNDFTVFNAPPATSAGNLMTATFNIVFYDDATLAVLGGYTTGTIDFGNGLPAGFYAMVTISGLAAFNIDLNTTNVFLTQQIATHTGPASRVGIVIMSPPVEVGVGSPTVFIAASTIGPAAFYNVNGVAQADPGYRIAIAQPVPTEPTTWGGVKGRYR